MMPTVIGCGQAQELDQHLPASFILDQLDGQAG